MCELCVCVLYIVSQLTIPAYAFSSPASKSQSRGQCGASKRKGKGGEGRESDATSHNDPLSLKEKCSLTQLYLYPLTLCFPPFPQEFLSGVVATSTKDCNSSSVETVKDEDNMKEIGITAKKSSASPTIRQTLHVEDVQADGVNVIGSDNCLHKIIPVTPELLQSSTNTTGLETAVIPPAVELASQVWEGKAHQGSTSKMVAITRTKPLVSPSSKSKTSKKSAVNSGLLTSKSGCTTAASLAKSSPQSDDLLTVNIASTNARTRPSPPSKSQQQQTACSSSSTARDNKRGKGLPTRLPVKKASASPTSSTVIGDTGANSSSNTRSSIASPARSAIISQNARNPSNTPWRATSHDSRATTNANTFIHPTTKGQRTGAITGGSFRADSPPLCGASSVECIPLDICDGKLRPGFAMSCPRIECAAEPSSPSSPRSSPEPCDVSFQNPCTPLASQTSRGFGGAHGSTCNSNHSGVTLPVYTRQVRSTPSSPTSVRAADHVLQPRAPRPGRSVGKERIIAMARYGVSGVSEWQIS